MEQFIETNNGLINTRYIEKITTPSRKYPSIEVHDNTGVIVAELVYENESQRDYDRKVICQGIRDHTTLIKLEYQ